MKKIYLDYNFYIQMMRDSNLCTLLKELSENKDIKIFYSPAHIEELYKAYADDCVDAVNTNKIIGNIKLITKNNELLPSVTKIKSKIEDPMECLERVCDIDTREIIKNSSIQNFENNKKFFNSIREEDSSNLDNHKNKPEEIWKKDEIKKELEKLNIKKYKEIHELNQTFLYLNKNIDPEKVLKEKDFHNLKNSHSDVEYSISVLFKVLERYGYFKEKKEETAISSTHDVSHSIYATECDYLYTMDKRFANKCAAIYSYLGVPTKVEFCSQNEKFDEYYVKVLSKCK